MNMKQLLKIEEAAFVLLTIYLFIPLGFAWWWFPLLFFVPDMSMVGYLLNPRVGAMGYNAIHHKGTAVVIYLLGLYLLLPWLQLVGLILLGHASFDRIFGYGLKYPDAFKNTHLGLIE